MHSSIGRLPWKHYSWFTMTIMHHIAWGYITWICVRKVGDDHRKSSFWSVYQVYGLSFLLLLIAIWRWILTSIVDEIDNWLLLQQVLVTNYRGNMVPYGNCRKVHLQKETQINWVFFFHFNFATTNTTKGFKINSLSSPYMPWLMRTMDGALCWCLLFCLTAPVKILPLPVTKNVRVLQRTLRYDFRRSVWYFPSQIWYLSGQIWYSSALWARLKPQKKAEPKTTRNTEM